MMANSNTAKHLSMLTIPCYSGHADTLPLDFIYNMVEQGLFCITYPDALEQMGKENIIQIHRDLPGASAADYRILLLEKHGKKYVCDDFIATQLEFYIPKPEKVDVVSRKMFGK